MPRNKILLAMFDIRPTKESGSLDFEKISRAKGEINLKKEPTSLLSVRPPLIEYRFTQSQLPIVKKKTPSPAAGEIPGFRRSILQEFEKTFVEPIEPTVELARVGAQIFPLVRQSPRPRFIAKTKRETEAEKKKIEALPLPPVAKMSPATRTVESGRDSQFFKPAIAYPIRWAAIPILVSSPASREVDFWLKHLRTAGPVAAKVRPGLSFSFGKKFRVFLGIAAFAGLFVWLAIQSGIGARENIVQNGDNAIANLEEAKQKLENFDFENAANSFALAYDDLSKASGTLNELGASLLSLFSNLPGLGKVKAANNLIEAGRSISKAGENLTSALKTLYGSNPLSFLSAPTDSGSKSLSKLFGDFRAVLADAERNIKKAGALLADVDSSFIPADKWPLLLDFKEKIPQFQEYIGQAIDYSDFLLKFVGAGGRKAYLVLLQNNSELRPTGGFPGTYALVVFENGNLARVFVDDIYQADSGLRENIIPPIPMQHITPNWGMRDANWFADFPTSAKKVGEFYQKNGGGEVDGVLAITPDVIAELFRVIGPIEMPEYGLTLDAGNFLTEIQDEVEYKADRSKPKKILSDIQPRFFERLSRQSPENWLEIFRILAKSAGEKHILAYFNNLALKEMALKSGLGGEVKNFSGDYLQIVFANVKGSKTDFMTDSSFDLRASIGENGEAEHVLTVNRAHRGGNSKFGFYNKDNSAYVKIYVPRGSLLKEIRGQTVTNFRPLIDYAGSDFKDDPDLKLIESGIHHPVGGVDVFEESGKTVFGFWLIVKPGQTKSVVLKYSTAVTGAAEGNYKLYWQKQSGTGSHINFSFRLPEGATVLNYSPSVQPLGNNLVLNSDLSIDREVDIEFRR